MTVPTAASRRTPAAGYPLADLPIQRFIGKTVLGFLMIGFGWFLVVVGQWKALIVIGPALALAVLATRAQDSGLRRLGKLVLDCLACAGSVLLLYGSIRVWQHFDHPLLMGLPLATAWLLWALARDEGFGPFPQEPIDFGGGAPYVHDPESAGRVMDWDEIQSLAEHEPVDDVDLDLGGRSRIHDNVEWTHSSFSDDGPYINPATGLSMVGDSMAGFDTGGNPYGSNLSDDFHRGGMHDD